MGSRERPPGRSLEEPSGESAGVESANPANPAHPTNPTNPASSAGPSGPGGDVRARCEAYVGRVRESRDTLSPRSSNHLLATLDDEPTLRVSDPLPVLFHWLHFDDPVPTGELKEDGHERLGTFLPPVPYPRRMWAGSDIVFHRPLLLGRAATRRSTIESVTFKSGSSGPLCFVVVRHEHVQEGESCLTDRHTVVYRQASAQVTKVATRPTGADASAHSLSATVLFRYSALTFNSHRIHLDRDYARDVEGYPGLVVHGPLMATLLMRHALAAERSNGGSRTPSAFRFRALAPLFDGEGFHIDADASEEGSTVLTLVKEDGVSAVSGTIDWRA